MRGAAWFVSAGVLAASIVTAPAAELRVLSVGSVQIAAKALAASFMKETGNTVTLTIVSPDRISQRLTSQPFDMLIASIGAMDTHDKSGLIRSGTRTPLARAGIGVMVREGAPVPDVSTADAFKRTLLAARSIVHGDPSVPNQSGVATMKILANAGILDAVKAKSRPAGLADGFALVAKGEVELALFNLVELPPGVRLAGPVPAPLREYTTYETAVLAKGAAPDAAQAFIKYLTGAAARKTWEAASLEAHPYR